MLGRFLLGCNSTYAAGTTGGEASHTLTVNEIPSHQHAIMRGTEGNSYFGITGKEPNGGSPYQMMTSAVGGGAAHNNLPPYLSVYIWKRTK